MFSKLKNIATNLGNKKQRKNFDEQEFKRLDDFAIEMTQLELQRGVVVTSFIKNSVDSDEFPTYILRKALHRPVKMTEPDKKAKIEWLKDKKIGTRENDGEFTFFELTVIDNFKEGKIKESI